MTFLDSLNSSNNTTQGTTASPVESSSFSFDWLNGLANTYSGIMDSKAQVKEQENEAKRLENEATQKAFEKLQVENKDNSQLISGVDNKMLIVGGVGVLALILVVAR